MLNKTSCSLLNLAYFGRSIHHGWRQHHVYQLYVQDSFGKQQIYRIPPPPKERHVNYNYEHRILPANLIGSSYVHVNSTSDPWFIILIHNIQPPSPKKRPYFIP